MTVRLKTAVSRLLNVSKLTVASSKLATFKTHLPPVKNVGSKMSLPGNSVTKVISWQNKLIFTEIFFLFIK